MSRQRELPDWDELADGEGPLEARTEYGFVTPDGKRVWGVRAHAGASHDTMATRRLKIKGGREGGGESWHSPSDVAVRLGHVRYIRVPKAPEYRTKKHTLHMSLHSGHPSAVEHAIDLVKQHAPEGDDHEVVIEYQNLGIHNPECHLEGSRGLTPTHAVEHLRRHLRGGCTTAIAAARQLPFGGNESVADALICQRLHETTRSWSSDERDSWIHPNGEEHHLDGSQHHAEWAYDNVNVVNGTIKDASHHLRGDEDPDDDTETVNTREAMIKHGGWIRQGGGGYWYEARRQDLPKVRAHLLSRHPNRAESVVDLHNADGTVGSYKYDVATNRLHPH